MRSRCSRARARAKKAFVHRLRLSRCPCERALRTRHCTGGLKFVHVRQHEDIRVPGNMESFSTELRHTRAVIVFTVFASFWTRTLNTGFPFLDIRAPTVSQFICKIISRGNTCSKGMDDRKKLHYHIVTRKFVCKSVPARYRAVHG